MQPFVFLYPMMEKYSFAWNLKMEENANDERI